MKRWDPSQRVIAHIDMDAFYASVEALDRPDIRGKPVIVGGSSRRGVVSAASYEARAFGVHSAMPLFQARRLCPYGIFLPVRMSRYRQVSRVVMGCLHGFSPLVEQVSVDEAYIDLTGTEKLFGDPWTAAGRIKNSIREKTSLTCSIGMSTSKLLAKIASDMHKPDGITIIPPDEVRRFLDELPIGRVPGIGERSEEGLAKIGIKTIGDVLGVSPGFLIERFGKFGERLRAIAEGREASPVVPLSQPKSVSHEQTLEEDTDDTEILKRHLIQQAGSVGTRLRRYGLLGKTVVLKIKFADFRQITHNATLDRPTQVGRTIYGEAVRLLEAERLAKKVRLIGVGVSNLEPAGDRGQLDLFFERSPGEEKWERAERAIDEVVRRFGRDAIKPGSALD
ncbi:MAG TPA: DNA polymerase IV [Patescibacteria group bacterium]|nr:DNA polymerase IV [Patescibacteria group bacterium]